MASVVHPQVAVEPPDEVSAATPGEASPGTADTARSWLDRRIVRVLAVTIVLLCALAFLFPVIVSSVNADDRYWYLWVGWRADGSVLEVFRWSWGRLDRVVDIGRVNTLTQLERRLVALPVIEAAVATSTPIFLWQGLVKIILAALSVLSGLAVVQSLRWRAADGYLVRAGRRTLYLAAVASVVAVAVGAQAQAQTRNGWTAYPVNTYGAALFIFGTIALLLWLTRLVAERSRTTMTIAVVVLVLLAMITGLSYELVYPAVPVAAAALLVVPVTDASLRAAGRRAKLVTGSAYFGTFAVVFVAVRLYIRHVCAQTDCYAGVTVDVGRAALRTMGYNFLSAFPGFGGNELHADMGAVGLADQYPVGPTTWSVLIGLAATVALMVLWWSRRPDESTLAQSNDDIAADPDADSDAGSDLGVDSEPDPRSDADPQTRDTSRRAEGVLLLVGAGLFLLIALGTAAVMGLSPRSHAEITEPGVLYRNAMVSWSALAFCGVLVVLAVGRLLPGRAGLLAWTAMAVVIGTIGALTLPSNLMAMRANRIASNVVDQINWEVVQGDTTPGSDARRCELFRQSAGALFPGARNRLLENANYAFEHFHGQRFCSDPSYPGGPGQEPDPNM